MLHSTNFIFENSAGVNGHKAINEHLL